MTISVLQEKTNDGSGGGSVTSVAVTLSSSVTAGSAIHVFGTNQDSVNPTRTFSDGVNTYGSILDLTDFTGLGLYMFHCVALNVAAGSTTITLTFGSTVTYGAIWAREIGQTKTSGPDVHNGANVASSTTPSLSATNTVQPALVSALIIGSSLGTQTPGAGSGMTAGITGWVFGGATADGISVSNRVTTAGAQNANFTFASAASSCIMMAIFDELAAAPPPVIAFGPMPKQLYVMP